MKVFEVVSFKKVLTKRQEISQDDIRRNVSKKHEQLGRAGAQGVVFAHKTHPNVVNKIADTDRLKGIDTYEEFIKLAQEHEGNPFFPKIYNYKIVRNPKTRKEVMIVQMEKLNDISSKSKLSSEAKISLFKQIGVSDKILGTIFDYYNYGKPEESTVFYPRRLFATSENRALLREKTKNPKFKEAMEALEPLFKKAGSDLHGGNIMVRITGIGLQLVLLDPFKPWTAASPQKVAEFKAG